MKILIGLLMMLPLVVWGCDRTIQDIHFEQNVGGYLKRAADANTVEIAAKQLRQAIEYVEAHKLTEGYTSVLYPTPDEDIAFWYNNLVASAKELDSITPETTQLERTNVLMKLRETLLDNGESGSSVTVPHGISIYPNNVGYAFWGFIGWVLGFAGLITAIIGLDEL